MIENKYKQDAVLNNRIRRELPQAAVKVWPQ